MEIIQEKENQGGRFVAREGAEQLGYMTYVQEAEGLWTIDHTRVQEDHEGKGVAKALLAAAVRQAWADGVRIRPVCSYVAAQFERNRDFDAVNAIR